MLLRPGAANAECSGKPVHYLANFIVNTLDLDPVLRLDFSTMYPDVLKFGMDMIEDVGDWYTGLTSEIEAAYELFLETEL